MPDYERAMLCYVMLADLSQQKRQQIGRDKFLILAAAAACRAGWPEVAARCRGLVLTNNPVHLVGRHETFADALRSPDFAPFLRRVERFCPQEQAEHLLSELGLELPDLEADEAGSSGHRALALLSQEYWASG